MPLRLVQFRLPDGATAVAALNGEDARRIDGAASTYALAMEAITTASDLKSIVGAHGLTEAVDIAALAAEDRFLPPLTHPHDTAHTIVSGTGLTHLGSAEGRDKMHKDAISPDKLTDSVKMFRMGLDGGKPAAGRIGVQPEWFYKGDGSILVAPGAVLAAPGFALDGGEEPEIAGLYLVGPDGTAFRVGFSLGNEFSDHVTERGNYLWLAHSKLRPAALGPELLVGELPAEVRGVSRILRDGRAIWQKPFLSGEANMSHSFANLEHHHFKYSLFRRPGDVHVHFFGTATLSCSDGVKTEDGDVFEIEAAPFSLPCRNRLRLEPAPEALTEVRSL